MRENDIDPKIKEYYEKFASELYKENYNELKNKQSKYTNEVLSSQFREDKYKHYDRIIMEFIEILNSMRLYSVRDLGNDSLFISQLDLILESVVTIKLVYKEGVVNPIKRELRYILEFALKYTYIDFKYSNLSLNEKICNYESFVKRSSIEEIEEIEFLYFDENTKREYLSEYKRLYSELCKYVHPSKEQISDYEYRMDNGHSIGFESNKHFDNVMNICSQVFEMIIILFICQCPYALGKDMIDYFEYREFLINKRKYIKYIVNKLIKNS